MSELISREDAVNEIHKYFGAEIGKTPTVIDEDGDELYVDMTTVNSLLAYNKELSKRIKALPSAEAVEVVRCKDCKYWHSNTGFCDIWSYPNVARRTLNCDYCSRGERREEGEA